MTAGITFWLIVTMANLVVGACVGLTGVAGFLLPITYTSPVSYTHLTLPTN